LNALEETLTKTYGLAEVTVVETGSEPMEVRDALGRAAAAFLDKSVCDGSMIALAGGRQMWCMVRNLSPRRVKTSITALGMHHADPVLLHVHPNTLVTLLWLLYSPRSEAHVIAGTPPTTNWMGDLPHRGYPSYFVISSCAQFYETSLFAQLLGDDAKRSLRQANVLGDFAYIFFDRNGKEIDIPLPSVNARLPGAVLRSLSERSDARIVLVAGGAEKHEAMRVLLQTKLCNTVITDVESAKELLK
jgi:DNA-binding transcriptional regulator LsrR (DeoR family)